MEQAYEIEYVTEDRNSPDGPSWEWDNVSTGVEYFPKSFTGLRRAKRALSRKVSKSTVTWGQLNIVEREENRWKGDHGWEVVGEPIIQH